MKWLIVLVLPAALAACGGKVLQTSTLGAAPQGFDTRIVAQIQRELVADPELGEFAIDVNSKDGLVVLSGVAPNEGARERATEIARRTPNVEDISNQLDVKQAG